MLPSSLPLPHLWNFLLSLPAPVRITGSRFQVPFRFQSLSSKYFRFHKNLTASASTSLLRMKQIIVFSVRKQASLLCKLFYLISVVDSILLLLLLHFTPTVVASLKIQKREILKKLLPLPVTFQHFSFRLQPLSSKCLCFHEN